MPGDLRSIAQLLTSELVTNAIAHGKGAIELRLKRDGAGLRVGVHDESDQPPRRQTIDAWSSDGRGLLLLERLASRWGTDHDSSGKLVWFTLRTQ